MRIDEFLNMPILSEEAFNALDRYKFMFWNKREFPTNKNYLKYLS